MAFRTSMKSEKPTGGILKHFAAGPSTYARLIIRFFQFLMGIVVIGLYAQDLNKAHREGKYTDPKWAYATACGSISSIASIVLVLPFLKSCIFWFVDGIIFILYIVLFGIFGKMFIKEDPEGNKGIIRMKNAAWIDMVNMILWALTFFYGLWTFFRARKASRTSSVV